MIILGIDTSERLGSIALCRDDEVIGEEAIGGDRKRHAQTLIRDTRDLLTENALTVEDIDLIAVSIGPGSFTGLRVGVVMAKTLSWLTGCRLAAVDTLEAIAAVHLPQAERIHVISDAQRGDVFLGIYSRETTADGIVICHREQDIRITAVETLRQDLTTDDFVTGPALRKYGDVLPARCSPPGAETPSLTAVNVARIGQRLARQGHLADAMTLEPFYLRRSAAEEKADRQPTTG